MKRKARKFNIKIIGSYTITEDVMSQEAYNKLTDEEIRKEEERWIKGHIQTELNMTKKGMEVKITPFIIKKRDTRHKEKK